jgi:hypothetical protein
MLASYCFGLPNSKKGCLVRQPAYYDPIRSGVR